MNEFPVYWAQDKKDDVKAGVKSTALLLGESTKLWSASFGAASIASFALAGLNAHIGIYFFLFIFFFPFYSTII